MRGYTTWSAFLPIIFLLGEGIPPESALAQEGFRLGRIEMHPEVSLEGQYNDNVFLQADKTLADGTTEVAEEDYVVTLRAGFTIEKKKIEGEDFGFHFRYFGRRQDYFELNTLDSTLHDVSTHFTLGNAAGDVVWKAGGSFLDTREPITAEFASNFNPTFRRTTYTADTSLHLAMTTNLKVDFNGSFSRNLFDQDFLDDQEADLYKIGGTIVWQVTPLTGIGINYSFYFIDYFIASLVNADSSKQTASLIFKWDPISVLHGELWLGYSKMRFEGVAEQNREDFISRIELRYRPKSTRVWSLIASREVPYSYFRDVQSFRSTHVELNVEQQIAEKWKVKAQALYHVNEYNFGAIDFTGGGIVKKRKDEGFSGQLTLSYVIQKWIKIEMEYRYRVNDSNFDIADYGNNRVFLRCALTF